MSFNIQNYQMLYNCNTHPKSIDAFTPKYSLRWLVFFLNQKKCHVWSKTPVFKVIGVAVIISYHLYAIFYLLICHLFMWGKSISLIGIYWLVHIIPTNKAPITGLGTSRCFIIDKHIQLFSSLYVNPEMVFPRLRDSLKTCLSIVHGKIMDHVRKIAPFWAHSNKKTQEKRRIWEEKPSKFPSSL